MRLLKSRLLSAETDFLSALVEGGDALTTFDERWSQLIEDIDRALSSDELDSETSALAHATASRIATLADISAEVFDSYNTLTSSLMDQLDSMMTELTLEDCETPYRQGLLAFPSLPPLINPRITPVDVDHSPLGITCRKRRRYCGESEGDDSTSPRPPQ